MAMRLHWHIQQMRFSPPIAALLLAAALASPLTAEDMNPPPRGVALLDKEAESLVANLSLESEQKLPTTLWTPSPADINRLEKLLPEYMGQLDTPDDYQPLEEYYRQYAGVIRNGKRMIFVNLFHSSSAGDWVDWLEKDPDLLKRLAERGITEDQWLYMGLTVCDGGAYFFTIRFDVETGTFEYPSFNGHA